MRAAAGAVPVLVLAGFASPGGAQPVAELAARCGGASGGAPWRPAGAVAYRAVASGLGLAAAGGSDIPGTSSTLGRRRGMGPRVALSARVLAARIPLPDLGRATPSPLPGLRSMIFGASLDAAAGLFDGLRADPLRGGILALDAIASAGVLGLSRGDGFQGNVLFAGVGARLGLLRESFGVPGISVSAMRRFLGEARLEGDDAPVTLRLKPVATSIRALIGKDLSAVGVLVGAGWDRYSGDVTLEDATSPTGRPGGVTLNGPTLNRMLFFGAVSRTWQVVQVTAEMGWGGGFDRRGDPAAMSFDPGAGSVFGSLSLRVTR